jgi:hypothetical protein
MSAPVRPRSDDSPIELGTGVNRPLIAAAFGLALLVLAAPTALYLLATPVPQSDQGTNQRRYAPHRGQSLDVPLDSLRVSNAIAVSAPQP